VIRDRAVSNRYAAALFGAAVKAKAEEAILADLLSLREFAEQDPRLQQFLEAPDVLTEAKLAVIDKVLGPRVHALVISLIRLMMRKKRVQHMPLVLDAYRALVEESLGMARAQVTSAVPLPRDLAEELHARLERLTGKKVQLETREDPSIVGGLIVTVGGKILDGSLRHRLEELGEDLASINVQ